MSTRSRAAVDAPRQPGPRQGPGRGARWGLALRRCLARAPAEPPAAPEPVVAVPEIAGFDPAFYRRRYGDLAALPDAAALRAHFHAHGRGEGRFPDAGTMIRALAARHGALPRDFIPEQYRALHADLAGKTEAWELEEHYLCFGRAEGRPFKPDLTADEADYARLPAAPDGAGAERPESFARLLARSRVLPGPWLGRFVLHEFTLLNADWLPRIPASRMDGLVLFLTAGIERLAPISLRLRFDPGFLRARAPDGHAGLGDADLYRLWLDEGIARDEPGTEAAALVQLLGEERFPESFAEAAYRACLAAGMPADMAAPGPGRFEALRHFVTAGFALPEAGPVRDACSARLLERIAEYHLSRGAAAIAEDAFARALRRAPGRGRLHHRRGDALRLLGRTDEATDAFVAASAAPGAIVWSHVHAIDGLLDRPGGLEEALDHLRRSAPDWHGSPQWRAAAHRAIGRSFAVASARARRLYAAGRRREADAGLTACLDRVAALIRVADPLPAPLPAPGTGRIVIVANRDLPQCDHYRVTQKVEQLEAGGWTVELFRQQDAALCRPALDTAAAAIFYRVAAFPEVLHAILYARALGIPTIYEIDDLIFDPEIYPEPLESFEGQITPGQHAELHYGVPLFRYAMQACETGLASTPALAEAMRPLVRSGVCHVLRNGLDARNRPFLARPHAPFSDVALTIFYGSGTRAHNRDFTDLAAPALLAVLERHAHVRLVVAGHLGLDARFARFGDRVIELGFGSDVTAYWDVLSGADINLAVLAPGPFADAKSEIKWLEAAACGVPSVVSATRTYREILSHGEDALLAETAAEWTDALGRLVEDPDLRRRIGERARARALAGYGPDAAVAALARLLPPPAPTAVPPAAPEAPIRAPARTGEGGRHRVLVVNVFFPPQTVGGATRVVRDNLDHILDHAAGRFELAVAASDLDAESPYRTRIDAYRGIPVHRIATPPAMHMDWRPFDPAVRPPFDALLDRFAPDLVHIHCVQRLTASVVAAVQARGIPYLVTVHDAWWISDFQFLTDADGLVRLPSPDPLADPPDRSHAPIDAVARRRGLKRLLDGAEAIVAVSETFAGLYRQAGFPRTIAVPNGVPRLVPAPRRPSPGGRVRLGHVGGRTLHKGATLVEAVLKAGRFENLALTLVDHALATDHVGEEVWGATPVRIVGKVPQERIGELYAEMDVLLAPSLWPESFGLVTREARASGLWVVAGDRGAIGEEIVDGVNGFRIDVGACDGLRAVLARIDADPARFLERPPHPAAPARTAADQGDDLIALYESLLLPREGAC